MTGWIGLLGSLTAALVLFLKWYLGAEQKRKRRQKYVFRLEVKLREAMANNDNAAIVSILHELRLYAENGEAVHTSEPDGTGDGTR